MQYETLVVERRGAAVVVKLNRPEKLNAINRQMHMDLQAVCRALRDDYDTRVVVLTGEGRAFSSGADLQQGPPPLSPRNELELRRRFELGNDTCWAIESLDQITIASINGLAVGGAVVLAMCCDIRLMAESAWLSLPEVRLGIPLTWNALPRLVRELGSARTIELVLTGDRITAHQGLAYGLVNHVYPDAELERETWRLVEKLLALPVRPVVLTKATIRALNRGYAMGDVTYSDPDLLSLGRIQADTEGA